MDGTKKSGTRKKTDFESRFDDRLCVVEMHFSLKHNGRELNLPHVPFREDQCRSVVHEASECDCECGSAPYWSLLFSLAC